MIVILGSSKTKVGVCMGDGSGEVHVGDAGADGYVDAGEQLGVGTNHRTNPHVPACTPAPASPDPPTCTYPYSLPHSCSHILVTSAKITSTTKIIMACTVPLPFPHPIVTPNANFVTNSKLVNIADPWLYSGPNNSSVRVSSYSLFVGVRVTWSTSSAGIRMDKPVNDRPASTWEDHLVAGEYGYWEVEQHENMHKVSVGMCVKMCRRVRDVTYMICRRGCIV